MRAAFVLTLAGLAAAPLAATQANRIESYVAEAFTPSAQLSVLDQTRVAGVRGAFNETIHADPGYSFRVVHVRLVNNGTVELGVHAWQFSAVDERGSDTPAMLGLAHQDMDAIRVRGHGGAMEGDVTFQMRDDARLTKVVWDGDLAQASGTWRSEG
jgi:hypothetical protein